MAVTAAPTGRLTQLRGYRAEENCWAGLGRHRYRFLRHELNHSTGTTYSLARTMLSWERAASSMARGSVRSLCTSAFNVVLIVRKASTSVCIVFSCCAAIWTFACVRMLTVTQTAKVASKIIPKTTQEGIIPPRLRTSVRVPIISIEICCTEAKEPPARGETRCDWIRSSTQYVLATLLTSHLPILCRFGFRSGSYVQLHATCGKGEGRPLSTACHPMTRVDCHALKLRGCLNQHVGLPTRYLASHGQQPQQNVLCGLSICWCSRT